MVECISIDDNPVKESRKHSLIMVHKEDSIEKITGIKPSVARHNSDSKLQSSHLEHNFHLSNLTKRSSFTDIDELKKSFTLKDCCSSYSELNCENTECFSVYTKSKLSSPGAKSIAVLHETETKVKPLEDAVSICTTSSTNSSFDLHLNNLFYPISSPTLEKRQKTLYQIANEGQASTKIESSDVIISIDEHNSIEYSTISAMDWRNSVGNICLSNAIKREQSVSSFTSDDTSDEFDDTIVFASDQLTYLWKRLERLVQIWRKIAVQGSNIGVTNMKNGMLKDGWGRKSNKSLSSETEAGYQSEVGVAEMKPSTSNSSSINSNADTLTIEMVDDFLSMLNGPMLHFVFYNRKTAIPIRFRPKFFYLYDISMACGDGMDNAINSLCTSIPAYLPNMPEKWVADAACIVCFRESAMFQRECCKCTICEECMTSYFNYAVEDQGKIRIPCPNESCTKIAFFEEVSTRLSSSTKAKFQVFTVNASNDPKKKVCPRCLYITQITPEIEQQISAKKKFSTRKAPKIGVNVTCPECSLVWCYSCHCPNHDGLSCKDQMKGDRLVRHWAKQIKDNQYKARRCPKCKVITERSGGCPHMQCVKCNIKWCYSCGGKRFSVPLFGGHDSSLSVFGCTNIYMADKKHTRRFIRGLLFTLRIVGAPFALALGIAALPIALLALLGYLSYLGISKSVRKYRRNRHSVW